MTKLFKIFRTKSTVAFKIKKASSNHLVKADIIPNRNETHEHRRTENIYVTTNQKQNYKN